MSLLLRYNPPCSSVLDLASGSGAMLARLGDNGFTDLQAVELDVEKFRLGGTYVFSV
jgi:ubiquinone/menaquinone biosynthesis C-methylase UbiE